MLGRMSTLNTTQIQAFQSRLQQREQQLLQELAEAKGEREQAQDAEDLPREPDANQTRESSDREVRHAEQLRDQHELQDVRAALQRIADGSYGECIDCGQSIALARLQAFPSAKRCIQCQTKYEASKQRGA
jgi:DnaK suppressor protein